MKIILKIKPDVDLIQLAKEYKLKLRKTKYTTAYTRTFDEVIDDKISINTDTRSVFVSGFESVALLHDIIINNLTEKGFDE